MDIIKNWLQCNPTASVNNLHHNREYLINYIENPAQEYDILFYFKFYFITLVSIGFLREYYIKFSIFTSTTVRYSFLQIIIGIESIAV